MNAGRVGAIILAAGSSQRMGGGDKLLADLAGRPVLAWTLDAFGACAAIDDLVVVTSATNRAAVSALCHGREKVRALVLGGRERQDSVWSGLMALRAAEYIAVHDGARPLITPLGIAACVERARSGVSVIAGGPAVDTIKVVGQPAGEAADEVAGGAETVVATLDRSTLRAVATPQVFQTEMLRRAHESARRDGVLASDDAALVERLGARVVVHDIGAPNPKITSPSDLIVAQALLGIRTELRVGIGIDAHRFAPGRRLVLGGIEVPHELGLAGHSDADVLTHAIIDALLGGGGLGDIGAHFGMSDPAWAGADSVEMLTLVLAKLAAVGARPQSVDATVIAERPRLRPQIAAMRERLTAALGLERAAVNVAATTMEGMGALGRGEGIAAHAVAILSVSRPGALGV